MEASVTSRMEESKYSKQNIWTRLTSSVFPAFILVDRVKLFARLMGNGARYQVAPVSTDYSTK